MYACPSCNIETISAKDKFNANRASPVRCSECHQLSSVSGNIEGLLLILVHILLYISLFASFYYWTWIPIISLVVITVLTHYLIYKYAPLKVIKKNEVKRINYLYNLGLAAIIIMVIFTVMNNA